MSSHNSSDIAKRARITKVFERIVAQLQQKEFAFSVTVSERVYDVYHTIVPVRGDRVTVALRIVDGCAELGFAGPGHLPREAVAERIRANIC